MRDKIITTIACGFFAAICFGLYSQDTANIPVLIVGIVICCILLIVDFGSIIARLIAKHKKRKPKTISSYVFVWFIVVAAIGALGAFLLFNALTFDDVRNVGILIAFGIVFSVIGAVGAIGAAVLLIDYIKLKRILSFGKEATGHFIKFSCKYSVGTSVTRIGRLPTEKNYRYQIFFKYNGIEAKSNNIFTLEQAEKLEAMGKFAIKYIGSKAVIIEDLSKDG